MIKFINTGHPDYEIFLDYKLVMTKKAHFNQKFIAILPKNNDFAFFPKRSALSIEKKRNKFNRYVILRFRK